jgi:hypothetical protein
VLAGTLVFAVGCDPGWSYHVPDPSPGATALSDGAPDIALRVRGHLFTSMLTVEIALTNGDSAPLVVHQAPFQVLDASRRPLPWYSGRPPAQPCDHLKQDLVTLERDQICTMRGNFQVRPNAGVLGGRNPTLRTLAVVVDGLERGGAPVSRSVMLEWD